MAHLDNNFNFWMPARAVICKGGEAGADKTGKRWIEGIASTDDCDLQGEIVEQNGIDFSYFLKHGYFNDDHKPGPEHKVGEPTEAKVTKKGLWVKGFLFKNHDRADYYWELMRSLDESGSSRRVGFSIQGKVIRRRGSTISKCWIQDIAITTAPVNSNTWAEIVKSLNATLISKAQSADNVVVAESLDDEEHDQNFGKSLSFYEAVTFLEAYHKLPRNAAMAVAKVVFDAKGAKV